jgi:hypothetical protein
MDASSPSTSSEDSPSVLDTSQILQKKQNPNETSEEIKLPDRPPASSSSHNKGFMDTSQISQKQNPNNTSEEIKLPDSPPAPPAPPTARRG